MPDDTLAPEVVADARESPTRDHPVRRSLPSRTVDPASVRKPRAAVLMADALGLATVGGVAAALAHHHDALVTAAAIGCIAWAAAGVAIAARQRRDRLGPLVALAAAVAAAAVFFDAHADGSHAADLAQAASVALLLALLHHIALSLPTGQLTGPRRRIAAGVGYAVGAGLASVLAGDTPGLNRTPILIAGSVLGVSALTGYAAACRAASPRTRGRLQWAGWGVLVAVATGLGAWALASLTGWPPRPGLVAVVASVLVAAGLSAGSDPRAAAKGDRVVVGTTVTVGLLAVVAGLYFAIVVGLHGVPSSSQRGVVTLSMAAAAAAALAVFPARRWLEEFANQRVYGERHAPDEALRTFAGRMSRAVPMDELLLQLAESLHKTMHLHAAEVWTGSDGALDRTVSVPDRGVGRILLEDEALKVASRAHVQGGGWLAVWVPDLLAGRDGVPVRAAAIAHLGELLGFIVVERGADAVDFSETDTQVLADLARQVGLALHNVRLDSALQASLEELQQRNLELQASRSRLVATADESRRTIERNLHDGAQQHLVAMAVKLGLTRQLIEADPTTAATLLEELRADVQATLTELRELAHGIYPPLLRDRGLAEALRTAANRSPLATVVEAEGVGRFAIDAETAVYFCCLEAMQNAGKHAGPEATITVTVADDEDGLRFSVRDDGAGFDPAVGGEGHGFVNMRDRLGAMGGTLTIVSDKSASGHGTTIAGLIPKPGRVPAAPVPPAAPATPPAT